jgi:ferrochelatase
MKKTAIILFNLGGPDCPEAIKPFLFNLFNDKAIIGAPQPIRWLLAKFISSRRTPVAKEIYAQIGGKSPLLDFTKEQARALEKSLGEGYKVFIAMRYWRPFAHETALEVKEYGPDEVILLPLYPQYSTTTSGSSIKDWQNLGLTVATRVVCCYPEEPGFIAAMADLISQALQKAGEGTRLLFSAHGLPKKVIERGDPYQFEVEKSAAAVVKALNIPDLDWLVCYQSRVGPLEWIGPATDEEIKRAGKEGKKLVLAPIAFVSEHSETLVELDIEYRHLAEQSGVPAYIRVPALGAHPAFISGLARLVREGNSAKICSSHHSCGRPS